MTKTKKIKEENPIYINIGQADLDNIEPMVLDASAKADLSILVDPCSLVIDPSLETPEISDNTWYSYGTGKRFNSDGTVSQYVYTSVTVPTGYTATIVLHAYTEANYDGILLCASGKTITSKTSLKNTSSYAYTGSYSTSSASGNGGSTTISSIPAGTYKIYYISDTSGSSNGDYVYYTYSQTKTSSSTTTFSCTVSMIQPSSSCGITGQIKLNSGSWTTSSVTVTSSTDKVYVKANDVTTSASYAKYKAITWGVGTANSMNYTTISSSSAADLSGSSYITGFSKNSSSSGSPAIQLKINVAIGTEASTGIGAYYVTAGTVTDNRTAAGGSVTVTAGSAYHTTTYYWKFPDNTYRGPFSGTTVSDDTSVLISGSGLTQDTSLHATHSSMGCNSDFTSTTSHSGAVIWYNKASVTAGSTKSTTTNLSAIDNKVESSTNSTTYGDITGTLSISYSGSDIDAWGRIVYAANCSSTKSCSQTITTTTTYTFTSGCSSTNTSTRSGSITYNFTPASIEGDDLGTTVTPRTSKGRFVLTATGEGGNSKTAYSNYIYQEANKVESSTNSTTYGDITGTLSITSSNITAPAGGGTYYTTDCEIVKNCSQTITTTTSYGYSSGHYSTDTSERSGTITYTAYGNSSSSSIDVGWEVPSLGTMEASAGWRTPTNGGGYKLWSITATGEGGKTKSAISPDSSIYQAENYITSYKGSDDFSGYTSVLVNVPVIPASGGSVSTSDCTTKYYCEPQHITYASGSVKSVDPTYVITGSTVSASSKGCTASGKTTVKSGAFGLRFDGLYGVSVTSPNTWNVYQAANSLESTDINVTGNKLTISIPDIPASGGSVSCSDVTYTSNYSASTKYTYTSGCSTSTSTAIDYVIQGGPNNSTSWSYSASNLDTSVASRREVYANAFTVLMYVNGTYKGSTTGSLYQAANTATYNKIMGSLTGSVPDIPAAGGTIGVSDVTYNSNLYQTIEYTSGSTRQGNITIHIEGGGTEGDTSWSKTFEKLPAETSDRTIVFTNAFRVWGIGEDNSSSNALILDLYREANYVTDYGGLSGTLSISSPTDIPASGGSRSSSDCTTVQNCSQTVTYLSTATRAGSISYSISPSTISADSLAQTVTDGRTSVGTFTITATGEGTNKTKTSNCTVYQVQNKVENYDYNSSNYDYTIAPGSITSNLTAANGSLSWTPGTANHTHKYYYLYTSGAVSDAYTKIVSDDVKESILIICGQDVSLIEDSSGASSGTFSRFTYDKSARTATHGNMGTNECTDSFSVVWINAGTGSSTNDSGVVTASDSKDIANKAESIVITLTPNLIKRTTATYDGGNSIATTIARLSSGSTKVVTPTYSVVNSDIATITSNGIITGTGVGDTQIAAQYKSPSAGSSGYIYTYAVLTVENGIVLYLKSDGSWVPVTAVYKKINGSWVLQNNDDFASIFGTTDNLPGWVNK